MAHVDDAGSTLSQTVSDAEAADLVGATITLQIRRPDGTLGTAITGSIDGVVCSATIPSTAYPLPGIYTLQFEVSIDADNRWALPKRYLRVDPRVA